MQINCFWIWGSGETVTRFRDNIGTQFYPKAGLSYMISSEPWFKPGVLNSLRFRTSYGIAGNLPPAYANEKQFLLMVLRERRPPFSGSPETII